MTTTTELELPRASLSADDSGVFSPEKEMTAEDFETWAQAQTAGRFEWVRGRIVTMAPANLDHVDLNGWLLTLLRLFVEQKDAGAVLGPELLVRLTASRRVPDLFFLKKENLNRLKPTCVEGAPDLALEITSPDSAARDWREKYLEYESIGVAEYWVIDPIAKVVECYILGDDRHFQLNLAKDDKIPSMVLPGLYLRPSWLWQKPLPRVAGVLREMGVEL